MRAIEDDGEDGYDNLLRGYAASVREDEIAYVNLEQPLVDEFVPLDSGWPRQDPRRPRRSPVLGATPGLADALAEAGVDVAGLANNHAYDQGRRGLQRTMAELERVGVVPFGAGEGADAAHAPRVVEAAGARVAFVGFSRYFNQSPRDRGAVAARLDDRDRVEAALAQARRDADVVVAAVHWSRDFQMRADRRQRRRARRLVEAGADVIVGTGPHVLHEVERLESPRGQAVVAYSLGNLVSGMGRSYRVGHPPRGWVHPANVRPEARDGVVLRIELEVSGGRVDVVSLRAVPLWTQNTWIAHRGRGEPHRVWVERLTDCAEAVRAERLHVVREALGSEVELDGGDEFTSVRSETDVLP